MRRLAFIVMIIGMFTLIIFLNSEPIAVDDYSDLEELEINAKVSLVGRVLEERIIYQGTKLYKLDNDIELICECLDSLNGKEIKVIGVLEEYNRKKQIKVGKIAEIL